MQATFTCRVSRKLANSADEFLIPLQFQERIPIGGREGVDGAVDDNEGPGFGWTFPMKRMRIRKRESLRDFRGCRLKQPGDEGEEGEGRLDAGKMTALCTQPEKDPVGLSHPP